MITIAQKIKCAAAKVATKIATHEMNEWPPVCLGILYQPERPQQIVSADSVDTEA